ncbi:MAG: hypothetical protein WC829_05800 [Hyphomicrobium sp.]|jgi:hypothetical protein
MPPNNTKAPAAGETINQTVEEISAEAERMRRQVREDLEGDRDERLRRSEDEREGRDGDLELARGGSGRAYTEEDWSRARGRTDPERRRQMQDRHAQSILKPLPQLKDWRRCWISTTNPSDTPDHRRADGWNFCKPEQLRSEGWSADEFSVKDAKNIYAGCVMQREMIAMERPMLDHFDWMREFHHDQPHDQARQIYEQIQAAGEPVRHAGGRTSMAPGFEEMVKHTRPPSQFEG